jgi:hypothetical protein
MAPDHLRLVGISFLAVNAADRVDQVQRGRLLGVLLSRE